MSASFPQMFEPTRRDERRFDLEVQPGWAQGRGTFGGLVLAALVRAMQQCEPELERSLRSVTGELVGPVVPGACEITVELLRRGNAVSSFSASLRQPAHAGDDVLARATAVLGRTRAVDRTWAPALETAPPPWAELTPLPYGPFVPEFTQHLEFRLTGPLPFSGATEAIAAGFVRPRVPGAVIDAATVVALADAWWPSAFSIEPRPRPMATIAYTLQNLLGDRQLPGDLPLYHRARAMASDQGYFVDMRELWTPDGQLVALNQQTFVWIK
jgi:hypothetical protein